VGIFLFLLGIVFGGLVVIYTCSNSKPWAKQLSPFLLRILAFLDFDKEETLRGSRIKGDNCVDLQVAGGY